MVSCSNVLFIYYVIDLGNLRGFFVKIILLLIVGLLIVGIFVIIEFIYWLI